MLLNNWSEAFVNLFTNNLGIVSIVCLAIGLVLCTIECFIPGFGVCGITGSLFCIASVVIILVTGGEYVVQQFLYILGLIVIIMATAILIAVRSARFGLLSKSSLVQNGTDLPKDFTQNDKNYAYLMGKVGTTSTVCKPIGKVTIEGQAYQVMTEGEYIEKNQEVYVAEVDGSSIVVKKR